MHDRCDTRVACIPRATQQRRSARTASDGMGTTTAGALMSPAPARAEIDLEARREAARKRRFQQVEEERARREAEKNGGDAACVPCVCP